MIPTDGRSSPWSRKPTIALGLFWLLMASTEVVVRAQDRSGQTVVSVRNAITWIEERTQYRFLYRDALIAAKSVVLDLETDDLLSALERALIPHALELKVDEPRKQVLLLKVEEAPVSPLILAGDVMDGEHGARLPFATVTWIEDGRIRGTVANEAGSFLHEFGPEIAALSHLNLTISYVGFASRQIRVEPQNLPSHLPVRLDPETRFGPELIVSTAAMQTEIDTSLHYLVRTGIFSPLGETGVIRSLQSLPSVAISAAISPGLNVRGSRADGFQVLLDGVSIYNQNHFFGLFDAFNQDVLQTVALYYSVTPATLQGPPGGTLSFVTRTGSQTGMRGSLSLSNTAWRSTVEGPLFGGRGSWLLSGRRSYLNTIDLFNNAGLIALGLDVGRDTGLPSGLTTAPGERALVPGAAKASFYDVHGKVYSEWGGGERLSVNLYLGGDHTFHDAQRLVEGGGQRGPELQQVETSNDWGNEAGSVRLQIPHWSRAHSQALGGFSRFWSEFSKDDFVYTDPTQAFTPLPDTVRHLARPFRNENELKELKLEHQVDFALPGRASSGAGYSLHGYEVTYREESLLRTAFRENLRSVQLDLFAEYEGDVLEEIRVQAGIRSHYFSHGGFLRISPRLYFLPFPGRRISTAMGYSRNFQFLHRLYFEQSANADVWIMSTPTQPPGSVDHYTAGLYVWVSPVLLLQAEGYLKWYRNIREHETSAIRRRLRTASPLLDPWLHNNEAQARGVELMSTFGWGPLHWTSSYSLSQMEMQNDLVNDGQPFAADWDRRHQFTTQLQASLVSGLLGHAAWMIASGAPNALASFDASEPQRLSVYHRFDVGLRYRQSIGGVSIEARGAIFNVYDRKNTWYRSPVSVVTSSTRGRRVGFLNVDVYDLGFQPSFELAVTF